MSLACADGVLEAPAETANLEIFSSEKQSLLAERSEFVDRDGLRWIRVGEASALPDQGFEYHGDEDDDSSIGDWSQLSEDSALAKLRPELELGGVLFTLDETSTRRWVQELEDVATARRDADNAGESGAPGASAVTQFQTDWNQSVKPAVIINGSDDRLNWNWAAGSYPGNNFGAMSGAGTCTCNKMINNFTCVTNAHCVHDGRADRANGWLARKKIRFAAGAGTLPELPAGCYSRTVPSGWNGSSPDFDYAVLQLRGRGGAWCDVNHYNVGALGWHTTPNGGTVVAAVMQGYPSDSPLPTGFSYPTLSYQQCSLVQYPSPAGQLRYVCDSTGGQSGTGLYTTHSEVGGFSYRVRGIHWGSPFSGANSAVRMTSALAAWMGGVAGW